MGSRTRQCCLTAPAGSMDRREFLRRAASLVVVGGSGMAKAMLPRYARAQTISFTDKRIRARYVTYDSPGGNSGKMRGYLVQPTGTGPFPGSVQFSIAIDIRNPYGLELDHVSRSTGFASLRLAIGKECSCTPASVNHAHEQKACPSEWNVLFTVIGGPPDWSSIIWCPDSQVYIPKLAWNPDPPTPETLLPRAKAAAMIRQSSLTTGSVESMTVPQGQTRGTRCSRLWRGARSAKRGQTG